MQTMTTEEIGEVLDAVNSLTKMGETHLKIFRSFMSGKLKEHSSFLGSDDFPYFVDVLLYGYRLLVRVEVDWKDGKIGGHLRAYNVTENAHQYIEILICDIPYGTRLSVYDESGTEIPPDMYPRIILTKFLSREAKTIFKP